MSDLEKISLEEVNKEILILYIDKLKQENKELKARLEELTIQVETIKRDKRYGKH